MDRQTDRQTSCYGILGAMHTRRAIKTYIFTYLSTIYTSGVLVEYRTHNWKVAGSLSPGLLPLEQVANLLCVQANSASYPQRDGKWVVANLLWATSWRPSVADWATVCLLAAPWVQLSVTAGNGWPHNTQRHHWLMSISCHFRDCKALLVASLTHVSGAIIILIYNYIEKLHTVYLKLYQPKL